MDKALLMAKLFQPPYYNRIVEILSTKAGNKDVAAEQKFSAVYEDAFKNSKLETNYEKWLWNYLSNYDANLSPTW